MKKTFVSLTSLVVLAILFLIVNQKINAQSLRDSSFISEVSGEITSIVVQKDGKILVGGSFSQGIVRLNTNGKIDTTFNAATEVQGYSVSMKVQSDGKILTVGGPKLLRLNTNGTLDSTFKAAIHDYSIRTIGIQSDGKILTGGSFTKVGGQTRNRIARLNSDGTLDTTFGDPNAESAPQVFAFQKDGKILVGGEFTNIGGQPRDYIARLNSNGTLDPTFNMGRSLRIRAIEVLSDGKIMVGRKRVNANNGSVDTTFVYPTEIAYDFASAIQSDGKVLVGGDFPEAVFRMNTNGTFDPTFSVDFGCDPVATYCVKALALQPDGKILVGGADFLYRFNSGINPVTTPKTSITTGKALNGNSYVSLPKTISTGLSGGSAITIEYWFKGTNLQSAVRLQSGQDYIVAGWGGSSPTHILSNDGGSATGVRIIKPSAGNVYDGNWHHVAMTWELGKADGFKSYVDGVLVEKRNSSNNPLPNIKDVTPIVGAFVNNGTPSEFTNGQIARIRIWKTARTEAQIKESKDRAPDYPKDDNLLYQGTPQ